MKCRKIVQTGIVAYPCRLDDHEGPCEAIEIPSSISTRRRWLSDNGKAVETPEPEIEVVDRIMPEPTKQRAGDQPLPFKGEGPSIQDLVLYEIEKSKEVGISRYGDVLRPLNGRDTLQDALEESRDLLIYLTSLREERDTIATIARDLTDRLSSAEVKSSPVTPEMVEMANRILAWHKGE